MENEMRLIDANEAIKQQWYGNTNSIILRQYAVEVLKNAPTVEAVPVRHGRWIEEKMQTLIPVEFDASGEPVLHDYVVYRCDQCSRTAGKKEPYCHCGAKMDLKED